MSRKQEDLIREVMKQKEEEIAELRDLYFSLLTKRLEGERQLMEEEKVKPFTPERASQKSGFEDSTLILREEKEKKKKSGKEMEEELHERRMEIYAKMEKEMAELEQEIAISGIPTKDSVAFSEPVKELQTYKWRSQSRCV